MTPKEFIDPATLVAESFAFARAIYDSGYRPDVLLVLWRGGAPVGMVLHEYLVYKGLAVRDLILKIDSYTGVATRTEPRAEAVGAILSRISDGEKVLVVDDIYDTGGTIRKLRELFGARHVDLKVATLYLKKGSPVCPDFFFREVSSWIVFPHELCGLSDAEIRQKGGAVYEAVSRSR